MKSTAQTFFTQAEQDAINAAVQRAEGRTSGEIVPMVVSASYHYPRAAMLGAALCSLLLALLLTPLIGSALWIGSRDMYLFLCCFALLYFPLQLLFQRTPRLQRFFLSDAEVDEEVREGALTAFYREGLYRTREENGILIYISLFEQRAWILGDRGINEKIDPARWQSLVDMVTRGIQEGQRCEALCATIEQVGEILKQHFPPREDDRNELHNLIIR